MPARRRSKGVTVTPTMFIVAGVILGLLGTGYKVVTSVATKSDVESIKAAITPTLTDHDKRIRDLELSNAAHFGASPTAVRPSASESVPQRVMATLAQYVASSYQSQAKIPPQALQRRVVVPMELILAYNLQPTAGFTYALLGEDGRYYSLDDVLYVIIHIHLDEKRQPGTSGRTK